MNLLSLAILSVCELFYFNAFLPMNCFLKYVFLLEITYSQFKHNMQNIKVRLIMISDTNSIQTASTNNNEDELNEKTLSEN